MLTSLSIENFLIVERLELDFSKGMTAFTGETGAGKSIFIEAIELALGGRASVNMIRPGKEKADISLCFDITKFPRVIAYLNHLDLCQETNECIIRRVITSDGRSRCYVNGAPSTIQIIKEFRGILYFNTNNLIIFPKI